MAAITDFMPDVKKAMPVKQIVGFALPANTPKDFLHKVTESFKVAMKDEPVLNFAKEKYSELYGYYGEEARKMAENGQKVFAWLLYEEGIAIISPEKFNIPKP